MYILCHCYLYREHMDHQQATFIVWGDHCTIHFVLSTLGHIVLVANLLHRIFSSYTF
jgi:hypothetical protein